MITDGSSERSKGRARRTRRRREAREAAGPRARPATACVDRRTNGPSVAWVPTVGRWRRGGAGQARVGSGPSGGSGASGLRSWEVPSRVGLQGRDAQPPAHRRRHRSGLRVSTDPGAGAAFTLLTWLVLGGAPPSPVRSWRSAAWSRRRRARARARRRGRGRARHRRRRRAAVGRARPAGRPAPSGEPGRRAARRGRRGALPDLRPRGVLRGGRPRAGPARLDGARRAGAGRVDVVVRPRRAAGAVLPRRPVAGPALAWGGDRIARRRGGVHAARRARSRLRSRRRTRTPRTRWARGARGRARDDRGRRSHCSRCCSACSSRRRGRRSCGRGRRTRCGARS